MNKKKKVPYLIFVLIISLIILFMVFTSRDSSLKNEIKNSSWNFQTSDGDTGEFIFHENTADYTNSNGEQLSGHYKINSFSKKITILTTSSTIVIVVASVTDNYSVLTVGLSGFKGAEETVSSLMIKRN
ncbi:hypothetical protein ACWOFR_11295 [Carnobacterium gallinarum]|uniref:hypothetical protein n=1 Tax=Carnobacterium gallinarum TaxID=2749 RepID=UPI0005507590|nr:hypothetical protein [Carnobacterium gallinarum]